MRQIVIFGDGELAALARQKLSKHYRVLSGAEGDSAELAVVLQDSWNPAFFRSVTTSVPTLFAYMAFGEGVIGPLEKKAVPGCVHCSSVRKLMAGRDRKHMWDLTERLAETKEAPDAWASRTGMVQLLHVLENETESFFRGEEIRSDGRIYLLHLKRLEGAWHSFLPDPFCGVCGTVPDDSPELARIMLKSSPKSGAGSYRCRSIEELSGFLIRDYLDERTGLFNDKLLDLSTPFADMSVNLPLFGGDEGTAGRTLSYELSEMTAILEGLERYCGMSPRGKYPVVRDRYSRLKDYAIDPMSVGVHAEAQYEQPDFPFKPFDPERELSWVWGYSFLQNRPVLVPELLAYYSMSCGYGGGFVYESSNGCAVGGSLEEAIFHGIMEVAERDAFLLTWYAELPLRRVDPRSSDDAELNVMLDRLEILYGYKLHLFQATMEHGIPSIWAVMKNGTGKGINLQCAAGAHLDPVKAVKSAVFELAGLMESLGQRLDKERDVHRKLLEDSALVKQMDDHGMLYGLPEAEERLDFLLKDKRPPLTFGEAFDRTPFRSDLKEDLEDVLQRFAKRDMDVIVVDQTAPELSRNGLHCVKVLIPGMLPMTFGHHLRRVTGLKRLLEVPYELGYCSKPLKIGELNPYPHPFP
ncbi:TOMM precursor leader peptide-binding protein [Metabacillus sp. 84]|uniref:TOMM precursor leader peptide-binding protein n=1 Tax=Metabacillus sp. 84 TaxID=3404705 RepID=UPI003CEECE0F